MSHKVRQGVTRSPQGQTMTDKVTQGQTRTGDITQGQTGSEEVTSGSDSDCQSGS